MVPKQSALGKQARTPRIGPAEAPTPLPEPQALLTEPMNQPPVLSGQQQGWPPQSAKPPARV